MPIYEYCCKDCEQIFEEWQRSHTDETVACPVCGSESRRIISNTSFVLKGTGWYVTDYANGRTSHGSAKSDVAAGNGNGNGNGATEAKAEGGSGATPPKPEASAPKAGTPATQS